MKSLITGGLLVASLALTGNAAMAANIPAHRIKPAVRHIVASQPLGEPGTGIGQFMQSIFGGGPMQYSTPMQSAARGRSSRRSAGYDGSSYDRSPTVDTSSSTNDSSDQEAQSIQSANDENALNASVAAAEAQNEAAQSAALQTEINANNQ